MICAIGNINIDWICTLSHLPQPDEKLNIHSLSIFPGGSAANFAVGLARLGSEVRLFGHIGSDSRGREALQSLRDEQVDTSLAIHEKDLATGLVIILVDKKGQTMKLRFRGANTQLSPDDITPKLLEDIDITYAASVSIPLANQIAAVSNQMGIYSAIDVGEELTIQPLDKVREMICSFSIVFMNQFVFKRIFKQRPTLKSIQAEIAGALDVMTVTLGRNGSITAIKDKAFKTPTYQVKTVDTTGAGDAFAAGFIHYYNQKLPIPEVAKRAAVCASLQVTQPGGRAGLPTAQQVEDFLKTAEKEAD
jgi:ribokinase